MGSTNQLNYARHFIQSQPQRVLEVGSKDYGSTQNFRDVFKAETYVGLDMEPGPGVDRVHDLTTGTGGLGQFDLIICCSVLEHVRKPWLMAENLTSLLAPGGTLYLCVPWVWRYHAYPDDYFRFSWRGVESLFDRLQWSNFHYSSTKATEFWPCNPEADNAVSIIHAGNKHLPYLEVHGLGRRPRARS
jgi:SAM-dependent methyltransferase